MLSTMLAGGAASLALAQSAGRNTRNLLIVTSDGLRWQDVFRGADAGLLTKKGGGVSDEAKTRSLYWRAAKEQRRQALMPFLWSVVSKQGQLYGNRDAGSEANLTNPMLFSYPGYNEMMTGFGDPAIDSNDKKYNQNITVLEWLNRKPALKGKIAAFGAWELFPYILNSPRSGVYANAGYEPMKLPAGGERQALLNRLKIETGIWGGEALDAPMFLSALDYFKAMKPRVFWVALGDTDEWAHHNRYDLYLDSVRRVDSYVKELWDLAQSMPEYQGTTSLLMTVDHGRGNGSAWTGHGQKVPDSREVWMAMMGPDTRPLGERTTVAPITLSQLAPTIAALMGEDPKAFSGKAPAPVADAVGR